MTKPSNFPPLADRDGSAGGTTLGLLRRFELRYLETLYLGKFAADLGAPFHGLPRGARGAIPARRCARLKVLCSRAYNKALRWDRVLALSFLLILHYTYLVTG